MNYGKMTGPLWGYESLEIIDHIPLTKEGISVAYGETLPSIHAEAARAHSISPCGNTTA